MMKETLDNASKKMNDTFNNLLDDYSRIVAGKANAGVLDKVMVDYYGQPTPLKQMCKISVPEARMIVLQPWDKSTLKEIEKAILSSNLGITPENDGVVVRLPFPPLTQEKRMEIVKDVKKKGENCKIALRNIRREANDTAKKLEKSSDISEDDCKSLLADVQTLTDDWVKKVDVAVKNKEKDILTV